MKTIKENTNSLESTLDKTIRALSESYSEPCRDAILIEYYEFQKKLHNIIRAEYLEMEFKNSNNKNDGL